MYPFSQLEKDDVVDEKMAVVKKKKHTNWKLTSWDLYEQHKTFREGPSQPQSTQCNSLCW